MQTNLIQRVLVGSCLLAVASCGSGNGSSDTGDGESPTGAATSAQTCREDSTYRAVFLESAESTGDIFSELRREVGPDRIRTEPSAGFGDGMLVTDGGDVPAWTYEGSQWESFPARPVRPLRTPWVDNFVSGAPIADALQPVRSEAVEGIDADVYEPTFADMTSLFPGKFQGTEYDADASTFVYWIDECDAIIQADLLVTFGGADAEFFSDMGPGLTYSYTTFDVGAPMDHLEPNAGALPPIPDPS